MKILAVETSAKAASVALLDGGKLLEENSPNEFFDHPQHPRTKLFLSKVL